MGCRQSPHHEHRRADAGEISPRKGFRGRRLAAGESSAMNGMVVLALLVAWLLGTLIVASLWPREPSRGHVASQILPLGFIVGLAATSITFFAASLISARPALLSGALEVVVVFALF